MKFNWETPISLLSLKNGKTLFVILSTEKIYHTTDRFQPFNREPDLEHNTLIGQTMDNLSTCPSNQALQVHIQYYQAR